jgi:hypothetical protein
MSIKNRNDFFEIKCDNLIYKQEIISYSSGGIPIYMLTITGRGKKDAIRIAKRKVIVI